MLKVSILLLTLVVGRSLTNATLPEIQERFAEQSQLVEPRLTEFLANNNALRLDLMRAILGDFAYLTTIVRQNAADLWEFIENHEDVNEQCMPYLSDLFNYYYVWVSTETLWYAARDVEYYMWNDAETRIYPKVHSMSRENSRSISQIVQTLASNRITDNMDGIADELESELEYYKSLWNDTEEMLRGEIQDFEQLDKVVREVIPWWHDYAMDIQEIFLGWILLDIEYYCS